MPAESLRREPVGRRRLGAPLVLVVLMVALLEILVLVGAYYRAHDVREQLVAHEGYRASVAALTADGHTDGIALLALTRSHLDRLEDLGVGDGDLMALMVAESHLAADPRDTAVPGELSAAAETLADTLSDRIDGMDRQATWFVIGLIVAASIGWYIYFIRVLSRHRDVQRRVTSARAEQRTEQRLQALVRHSADVILVLDGQACASFVSPSSREMLGHEHTDLLGTPVLDLVDPGDAEVLVALLASQSNGDSDPVQLRLRHADGRELVTEGVLTDLTGEESVRGHVLTVRDVTEAQALADRLTLKAFWDDLTGLANRQLFSDRVGHALAERPDGARSHVLLFCDLDDFKNVNDSQGHGTGDRLLAEVGARIASTVRPGDTAARLGGDEFAVLMEDVDLVEARALGEELLQVLGEPVVIDGVTWTVQASIGLAAATSGQTSPEEALRNADVAMYWAKDRGKSTIATYDPTLHAEALDRLSLRSELVRALSHDELVLHYQPTVDLRTGRLTGFEALVRWQHPQRGLLSPLRFVPLAEQTGLIAALGRQVLREACRAAAEMDAGPDGPSIAVNIAAQQLADRDFVDEVVAVLAETGLAPARLTLEITESVVLQEMDAVTRRLSALRERGVRVAIDDFGTGYSSLAYLAELPVDVVKIDKSFIDRVTDDTHAASVTEAVIQMTRRLGMTTVAEGVEHPAQVAWLREMRCTVGQGYLWARPLPYADAVAFLRDRAPLAG